MRIDYTAHETGRWLTHTNRRLSYETICDGCGKPLENSYVTVITDRSGSEHGAVHEDDTECVDAAIAKWETGK